MLHAHTLSSMSERLSAWSVPLLTVAASFLKTSLKDIFNSESDILPRIRDDDDAAAAGRHYPCVR